MSEFVHVLNGWIAETWAHIVLFLGVWLIVSVVAALVIARVIAAGK